MISDIEDRLIAGMRDEVAGLTLTADVVRAAERRHRRRTAVHRTAYAAGVLGLAGAVAAVLTVGGTAQPGPGTAQPGPGTARPPVAGAEPANLQLASAVEASEHTSYRVKVTSRYGGVSGSDTIGTFDPRTRTGYLTRSSPGSGVDYYERLVDGARFVSSSGSRNRWKQYPGRHDHLAYDHELGGAVGATASPEQLFEALRQEGGTVTRTGSGSYHFVVVSESSESVRATIVGDVTLDVDKRIARVAYEETVRLEKAGKVGTSTRELTMEFSDYGTPVRVQRPTDVVVVR